MLLDRKPTREDVGIAGPSTLASYLQAGLNAKEQGNLPKALACFDQALALKGDSFALLAERAGCLFLMGRVDEALQAYTSCILAASAGDPVAEVLYKRAQVCMRLGRLAQAEEDLAGAIARGKRDEGVYVELQTLYRAQQRWAQGAELLLRAVREVPGNFELWMGLGECLARLERYPEALEAYGWAHETRPTSGLPLFQRGSLLLNLLDQPERALRDLQLAAPLLPDELGVWMALEKACSQLNRPEEARKALQRAVELDGANPASYSALIFRADHCKDASLQESYALRREYAARFEAPLRAERYEHTNVPDPKRRLRVGYVSADFCIHSAAQAFVPVLEAHDPRQVQVYCYSMGDLRDAFTRRVQRASARCYDVRNLDDAELAAQIHKDRIDILVDCSGHTAGNRLLAFARKPAPVQITAWGYVTGTGLESMDYCLTDAVSLPPAFERYFSETPLRLSSVLTGEPLLSHLPDSPPPCLGRGYPTLGCFNRYTKLNRRTLRLWAALMRQIPQARMLFKDTAFDQAARIHEVRSVFEEAGVPAQRLFFWGSTSHHDHVASYVHLDVALDPFPAGGGRTTLEALWMGVPVVTHLGNNLNSRVTASLLKSAGLENLVAATYEEYLFKVVTLVRDVERLKSLRVELRNRLMETSLYNPKGYTRELETAYREVWTRWCAGGEPPARQSLVGVEPALSPLRTAGGILASGGGVARTDGGWTC